MCSESDISIHIFFNNTPTTEIYTLSPHDALPICPWTASRRSRSAGPSARAPPATTPSPSPTAPASPPPGSARSPPASARSEEHTSELQSRQYLVCRLLLEKKKHVVLIKNCRYIER